MNIGFDAKRAFMNSSGLGNYSRTVIDSQARYFPDDKYLLFTPAISNLFSPEENNRSISVITPRGFWKMFHSAWRSSHITADLKKEKVEIYHGLSNELPAGIKHSGIKSIVTIHDLIFLRYPQFYSVADRNIYNSKSKHACEEADHIIAVSEQTKKDLIHFYNVPDEKISVKYQAIQPEFFDNISPLQLNEIKNKFHLPPKFILCVGTIEERKNLLRLINAIALHKTQNKKNAHSKNQVQDPEDLMLVVVGKETRYKKRVDSYIEEHHLQDQIIFLKNVSNNELPALYQCSEILIYPSIFEGFGLPIAEALASGIPVIANNVGVFREAGGDSAMYVNMENTQEFLNGILTLLTSEELRKTLIEKGRVHAEKFRPQVQAKQLHELYSHIINTTT